MNPGDRKIISRWPFSDREEVLVDFLSGEGPGMNELAAFVEELRELKPHWTIRKKEEEDAPASPALRVAKNVLYQAVPQGPELPPFLRLATAPDKLSASLEKPVREALWKLSSPALFTVYISPRCPFCPKAVEKLLACAAESPHVKCVIRDGTLFSAHAAFDRIQAAPTILLDGGFRWTGDPDLAELVGVAENRDPLLLSPKTLTVLIREGKAAKIAEMMKERGQILPAFLDILADEKWPVRLVAMVAFEHLAESAPELAASLAEDLFARFEDAPDRVRGDLLYILGETGRKDLFPALRQVAEGPYEEEVLEAAREAMEKISGKPG